MYILSHWISVLLKCLTALSNVERDLCAVRLESP